MAETREPTYVNSYRLRTIQERQRDRQNRQHPQPDTDNDRYHNRHSRDSGNGNENHRNSNGSRSSSHWWYGSDGNADRTPDRDADLTGERSTAGDGQYSVESSVSGGGTRDCFRMDCFSRGYQQAAQHCLGVLTGSMPLWLIVNEPEPKEEVKKSKKDKEKKDLPHGLPLESHISSNQENSFCGNSNHGTPTKSQNQHRIGTPTKSVPCKYGELVVLGYNGTLLTGDKGRRRSKFALCRRQDPNGVKPVKHHVVKNPQQSELIHDQNQHSVSFTLSRSQAIIVQYDHDEETDMFQIGRSSEPPIDFVVMDTIPGDQRKDTTVVTQSTISRFACRIIVSRTPPFTARIFAAGFDSAKNIFLGEKATKWYTNGEIDGLTTNGVLIMHPAGGYGKECRSGVWREVSVGGGIYALRESRSTPQKSSLVESEDNVLRDGTLIDLCGATLIWRSASGLLASPSKRELEHRIAEINAGRPQCPVGLNTLVLPSKNTISETEKTPYVYLTCGHVHGQHSWGKDDSDQRTCPMCRKTGPFVKLQMGQETSYYVDNEGPSHAFCPCGHMASEKTVKYWASVPIPHGCHGFRAACPYCATPLSGDQGYVKLIFQDNLD